MPSQKTIGEYDLLEVLGRGSFGTVWEARHTRLGRLAAVKILDRLCAIDRPAQRFLREAQIAGNLQHPHIVTLLEATSAEYDGKDTPFLAYELIEGVTLGEWCEFSTLSYQEVATLVGKLASAVHYAHERNIIHRDLKPANILVDLTGEAHVTDFGLARQIDDRLTDENVALGTVAYMSPEQAAGRSADVGPASDIFSLGVILYELLTGELPFTSTSIAGYVREVAENAPAIPPKFARKIPRDLATICLTCLARRPSQRYATAELVERELQCFVGGKPIQARPISLPERLLRWTRRQPYAAVLAGLLVLAAIVGPTIAIRQAELGRELAKSMEQLRAKSYGTDLYLAYQAWNEGQIQRTRQILDRSKPQDADADLRCFAWRFLDDRVNEAFRIAVASDVPINDFAVTEDRRQLLTVGAGGRLEFWDLATGEQSRTISLTHHEQFAVSLLGQSILVGDHRNGTAVLDFYDFQSGERIDSIPFNTDKHVESIRIAPGEEMVAVGARHHGIYLIDTQSKQQTFLENADRNQNVVFAPDSRHLAASFNEPAERQRNYGLKVWDLLEKEMTQRREFPDKVYGLSWRPDSKYLIVHSQNSRHAKMMSIAELSVVSEILHGRTSPRGVGFYPDGRTLFGADKLGSLFTRPVQFGGKPYGGNFYSPHEGEVNQIWYFGGGKILSASDDGTAVISHPGELQRQGVNVLTHVGEMASLAATQDGLWVGDGYGHLRDQNDNLLRSLGQPIHSLAALDDRNQIACGLEDGTTVIVSTVDGGILRELATAEPHQGSRSVNTICESMTPDRLICGGNDGKLRCWSRQASNPTLEYEMGSRIHAVVLDEDRQLAFIAGHSEHIVAVDVQTGREAYQLKSSRSSTLVLDRNRALLVSGHDDSMVLVWDLQSRNVKARLRGHTGDVKSLAISPQGDVLASAADDGTIRFWSLNRLAEIGIAYQARPDWTLHDLSFHAEDRSLFCTMRSWNRGSLVLRIGSPRQPFVGYTATPDAMDLRDAVTTQVTNDAEAGLACKNHAGQPGSIGVWLDERCKGYEVRATFHFDLESGTAQAFIDHCEARDKDNTFDASWHGISPEFVPGKNLTAQTDWVRVTHGDWHVGLDQGQHSYGAVLRLSGNAEATVRSIEIEARRPR